MNTTLPCLSATPPKPARLIHRFGLARMVRLAGGRLELRGGSVGDRGAAREWISLFGHEMLVDCGFSGPAAVPKGAPNRN